MQSRLLACVACGGLLAGVVQCRLLDYWTIGGGILTIVVVWSRALAS